MRGTEVDMNRVNGAVNGQGEGKTERRYLSAEEDVAARFMRAQSVIVQKNAAIMALQDEILRLQGELVSAQKLIVQQQHNFEIEAMKSVASKYGFPGSFEYGADEKGTWVEERAG